MQMAHYLLVNWMDFYVWSAEFSQRGWVSQIDKATQIFMRCVVKDQCWMNEEARGKAQVLVGKVVHSHVVGIDSDNTASRHWSGVQKHKKRSTDFRTTFGQEAEREMFVRLRRDMCRKLFASWNTHTTPLNTHHTSQLSTHLSTHLSTPKRA